MITPIKLKAALIKQLKTVFSDTDYKYYSGKDVLEAYIRPSFFTWLELNDAEPTNMRVSKFSYDFVIDYFQPTPDEVDMLNTVSKIQQLFSLGFQCENRFIKIDNLDVNYVGKDDNVAEISVTFSFYDAIPQAPDDTELMGNVDVTIN